MESVSLNASIIFSADVSENTLHANVQTAVQNLNATSCAIVGSIIKSTIIIPKIPTVERKVVMQYISPDSISPIAEPAMGINEPDRNFAVFSVVESPIENTTVFIVSIPKNMVVRSDKQKTTHFFIPLDNPFNRSPDNPEEIPSARLADDKGMTILFAAEFIICAHKNRELVVPAATPVLRVDAIIAIKTGIKLTINTPILPTASAQSVIMLIIFGTQMQIKINDSINSITSLYFEKFSTLLISALIIIATSIVTVNLSGAVIFAKT